MGKRKPKHIVQMRPNRKLSRVQQRVMQEAEEPRYGREYIKVRQENARRAAGAYRL